MKKILCVKNEAKSSKFSIKNLHSKFWKLKIENDDFLAGESRRGHQV
jgi:hypothetical protein